ncbi:FAD-dependent monooxygenase [Pseudonocardia nematodicida]|uniref:FAD-dependent monooxygenase n=1 Tax=Pseudonocardia nematodicida TaxID=1206997 RepID=A0ABV1KKA3_9PSEU
MRVVVAGGGIGGLALAQGLRSAGVEVVVLERDTRPEHTGGYRLHLDDGARAALARLLPAGVYRAVLTSSAAGLHRFSFCDHRMRVLASEVPPPGDRVMIGRIPLRTLLAHGLDVRWGQAYGGHEAGPDGRIHVRAGSPITGAPRSGTSGAPGPDTGTVEIADVLVGADGVGSAVVRTLAGRTLSAPTGVEGIAGRIPLDDDTRALLPGPLRGGAALAIAPGGVGAFLTVHDPATAPRLPDPADDPPGILEDPYLLWAPGMPAERFPRDPRALDGPGLTALAAELAEGWHPALRELVTRLDPAATGHFRFHAADPDADPAPWTTGPVTALGDAVHAMPPTGGRGAATAIRDADVLARRLVAARDAGTPVADALRAYEAEMRTYGPDAVRESLAPLRWQRRLSGPVGGMLLRSAGGAAAAREWLSRSRPR